ncbi:hypothetical protein Q1695_012366 [Nippostrongylus brasiliensis]|nr:hypothetical protein Q1695_012366 [Nippostrongylus brasiliensis]
MAFGPIKQRQFRVFEQLVQLVRCVCDWWMDICLMSDDDDDDVLWSIRTSRVDTHHTPIKPHFQAPSTLLPLYRL